MRLVDRRLVDAVFVCALLAALPACFHRPLGEKDDGGVFDVANPGQGGQTGTGCGSGDPGLELVGPTLTVLDQPPVSANLYTSLLWTGDQYLFIWRLFNGADVLMQRIDASGRGVGGNIRVRDYETALDVAWGSSRLAAVWNRQDANNGRRLMFQTFDGLGRPLIDETTLRVGVINYDSGVTYGPRIAAIGGRFAIVWIENTNQIFVGTVDTDGHLLRGPVLAGGTDLNSTPTLSLAAGVDRFVVGWNGRPPLTSPPESVLVNQTVVRAFSSELVPLGDANTLDADTFSGLSQVLTAGSGFLALSTHSPFDADALLQDAEVRITQLDGTGASTANGRLDPPASGLCPQLVPAVWNGDHLAMLWGGNTSADNGLTLSRFAPSGVRQGASIDLPTAGPAGRFYMTAHDGTLAFIWSEEIAGGYEVYFQRARPCP